MLKPHFIGFILIISILTACGNKEDSDRLNLREKKVSQKEEELKVFEQQLISKEIELSSRERLLDSLEHMGDTTGIYNSKLIGNWTVTMKCTETSCEGSALGDTKTERWNIAYHNNRVVVKVLSKNTITRVYLGVYTETGLALHSRQQEGDVLTTMNILLNQISVDKMEGIREINQGGKCKIIYSVGLSKIKTP
ncbi:MAG: hypothetical protein Q8S11_16765 [Daejeonella sp.]|uniref:hypothetical protein n=1 Tax=Daejeonella sp. TaxID=2805397 RepID=UPI00273263A0|nr:hypothetical protein [Daejeonella sp.]MDP3469996.1 hypothetical protein [Daejeonella sp.]